VPGSARVHETSLVATHVASPKMLRTQKLTRRVTEATQPLGEVSKKIPRCYPITRPVKRKRGKRRTVATYRHPVAKIMVTAIFCFTSTFSDHTIGTGASSMTTSCTTLGTEIQR
jgi:hypothetical protein